MQQYMLGSYQLGRSLAEKDLQVLMYNKLNTSRQCILVPKKINSALCCIRRTSASRLREVIPLFYSALERPHLECWIQFWMSVMNLTG